ncbi:uncharacterized protein LOC121740402 [Aricia agestis]|uniref:uncharacterized protein LOC121740402 n=1 Tax=Aricia agestis TaxID=91739 RepID=UPI001C20503E|nr:uncharacterized protein LOC121740402 [Aricia agestis]
MSRTGRFMCILYIVLLINLILEINGQKAVRKGPAGIRGDPGAKGEKGEKGERGDIGPYGKIEVDSSHVELRNEHHEPPLRGGAANAATSCQEIDLSGFESDKSKVPVYIYGAKPFEVACDRNEEAKTCLLQKKTMEIDSKRPEYRFPEAGKPFWLSTVGFDLLRFYSDFQIDHISQLKYLLKISYKVSIEIVVHCKNTVISKDSEKYLQIHLWDGQNVGPSPTLKSPAYYEIPDELNKCKDFPDETKWGTAIIKLTTSSNFIKDFYIRDIQKEKDQEIYIELKELCIYT